MEVVYFHRAKGQGVSIERLFDHIRLALPEDVAIKVKYLPSGGTHPLNLLRNIWFAFRHQGEVNHITGDCHYIALAMNPRRTVLTIHDCGHLRSFNGVKKWLYKTIWFDLPGRFAGYVTTISDFTKSQLIERVGSVYDKAKVIENCVDPAFHNAQAKESKCNDNLLLQVGTKENKNLILVAESLRGLKVHLRIIGRLSKEQQMALELNQIDYSCVYGISDEELLKEYRYASVVLAVSTYEGFGLPVIEAQAIGCPVVTSNLSPMKDVAGGAAVLVDPFDTDSIRAGVEKVLGSIKLRSALIAKGTVNAARFSQFSIAEHYNELYNEIVGNLKNA